MDKETSSDTSFEIIDKKSAEQANNSDKNGTLSSISSPYSISSPCSNSASITTSSLFSNLPPPPTSLPDFTSWTPTTMNAENKNIPLIVPPLPSSDTNYEQPPVAMLDNNQFPNPQFSAAIPAAKGIVQGNPAINQPNVLVEENIASGSGFFGFVKDALSSQTVSKIVEKAKHSVDAIITTLDPQMSDVIYAGSPEFVVLTDDYEILNGVIEAAQAVFGKAIVNGLKLEFAPLKNEVIGFENCNKLIEDRISEFLKLRDDVSVVVIENMLLKQMENWYDISNLTLKDPVNNIRVQTLSQATPVPVQKFISKETADIDIENKLSEYLMAIPGWQEEVSGIPRKDVIISAAKVLFKCYKDRLPKENKDVNYKTTIHK